MFDITIPSDETQVCVEIPVLDDDIALEGTEVFQVSLVTPTDVQNASPEPSRVLIIDNDGMLVSTVSINIHWIINI